MASPHLSLHCSSPSPWNPPPSDAWASTWPESKRDTEGQLETQQPLQDVLKSCQIGCGSTFSISINLGFHSDKTVNEPRNSDPSPGLPCDNNKLAYSDMIMALLTWKKPATAAAPHLSLCMPAIKPPALMSAPPVS